MYKKENVSIVKAVQSVFSLSDTGYIIIIRLQTLPEWLGKMSALSSIISTPDRIRYLTQLEELPPTDLTSPDCDGDSQGMSYFNDYDTFTFLL